MEANKLSKVRKTFRQWQSKHGSGAGYHIPERMREKAVALLDEYSVIDVSRELGVSRDTVGRWRRICLAPKRRRVKVREFQKSAEFLEVKGIAESSFTPDLMFEWVRRDGKG